MSYFVHRGIILFAMLNGRLPYNDNQITELEEDMKMQRLKFERTVSFGKINCTIKYFIAFKRNPLV